MNRNNPYYSWSFATRLAVFLFVSTILIVAAHHFGLFSWYHDFWFGQD